MTGNPFSPSEHAPGDLEGTRVKPTFHCLPDSLRQGGDLGPRSPNLQPWKNRMEEAMIPTVCWGNRQTPKRHPLLMRKRKSWCRGRWKSGLPSGWGRKCWVMPGLVDTQTPCCVQLCPPQQRSPPRPGGDMPASVHAGPPTTRRSHPLP